VFTSGRTRARVFPYLSKARTTDLSTDRRGQAGTSAIYNVLAYLKSGAHPASGKSFPEAQRFYATAFRKAFDGEISTTTLTTAIAAYERTVNSFHSPFDRWVRRPVPRETGRQSVT